MIDAYAWIEYFNGTPIGKNVKDLIENDNNEVYTNVITIAELKSSYERNKLDFKEEKKALLGLSKFYYITLDFAEEVGKLHAELKKERKNISLADSFVLSTAKQLKAKVVTGDKDFRGLKEVIMIK